MEKRRIRVDVAPGMFKSERLASFEAGGQQYSLIVDEEDVKDGTLQVYVVAQNNDEAVIDLPQDTFASGNRVRIPRSELLPAA